MLYYSEITGKTYATVKQLQSAEAKAKQKDAEKQAIEDSLKVANEKIATARKAWEDAVHDCNKILTDYCEKYGTYKVKSSDLSEFPEFERLLNLFF